MSDEEIYIKFYQSLCDQYVKTITLLAEEVKRLNQKMEGEKKMAIYKISENSMRIEYDFIPKQKIRDKIKELELEKEKVPSEIDFKAFYRISDLKNIEIGVLKSLLEE